jgi:hypothetical protein
VGAGARMIGLVVRRELLVGIRRHAVIVAAAAHLTVLGLFVTCWPGGVPALELGVHEQQRIVERWTLVWLLPWAAVRSASEQGDDLVRLCATAAQPPSRILLARWLALSLMLSLVVLAGLPAVILAQRMAAAPLGRGLLEQAPFLGLAVLAPALAQACVNACRDRLLGWTFASVVTAIAVAAIHPLGAWATIASVAGGAGVAAVAARRADFTLRYLTEEA